LTVEELRVELVVYRSSSESGRDDYELALAG
jgi:hypothetical protein